MYIPGAFFSTELFWSIIKWLMIFGVWGVFAYATWQEDRKIQALLKKPIADRDAIVLLKTLHRRDMQIWLQLSLLLVVVAANDIHYDANLLPRDFFSPPVAEPLPAEPAPVVDDKYDNAIKKNTVASLPFSDITEFNEQNSKQEAYIDWLKEHYESWFVTYFYLEKCKQVRTDDYNVIKLSLEKELGSAHAQQPVEGNILLAAQGSYKEMYADIPCDSGRLATTKSLYDANMQQIRSASAQSGGNPKKTPISGTGSAH